MIYKSFGSTELEKILKSDALRYMKLQTSGFIGKHGLHVLFHMAFNAAAVRPSLVSQAIQAVTLPTLVHGRRCII